MFRRLALLLAVVCVLLAWGSSRAGDRPTAEAIRAAASVVRPAVVSIETQGQREGGPLDMPNWPFGRRRPGAPGERRFEFHWPPREGQPRVFPFDPENLPFIGQPLPEPGGATGLILQVEGERGLILAPHPAVAGAQAVMVRFADGRTLAAKVVGTDAVTGLACLEVRDAKLPTVKVGKPEAVQAGDWVLALGGPAANEALTVGIVSTNRHPGEGEMAGTEVFQADLTLGDGMAGAPLVNLEGEVVGISAAPRRGPGGGLATVVPIDTAQATLQALARDGKVRRGWLGIMLAPLDPEARAQLKIEGGIQVAQAIDGQPAARAGIQAGDVILEFGGRKVADVDTFRAMVSGRKPGERVPVKVLRAGKELVLEVTLGEQGAQGAERAAPAPLPQDGEKLDIGLSLQPLTPDLAAQFGFEGDKGLLVTDVAPDSPAAKARPVPIARGELLKEVSRQPVATVEEARAAIEGARKANEKTLLVLVRGKAGARYVVLDIAP